MSVQRRRRVEVGTKVLQKWVFGAVPVISSAEARMQVDRETCITF